MTETRTDLDVDSAQRSTLLTQLAIRPLLRPAGDASSTCGVCAAQLTRLVVPIENHELTVLACSACSWHTRLIDGRFATANDVLTIGKHPEVSSPRIARGDTVTWYRTTHPGGGR